jgi:hypothetical protein
MFGRKSPDTAAHIAELRTACPKMIALVTAVGCYGNALVNVQLLLYFVELGRPLRVGSEDITDERSF